MKKVKNNSFSEFWGSEIVNMIKSASLSHIVR